jgi:hypothetical protein
MNRAGLREITEAQVTAEDRRPALSINGSCEPEVKPGERCPGLVSECGVGDGSLELEEIESDLDRFV